MLQSFIRMFTRFSFSGYSFSQQVVLVCLYQCMPLLEKLHLHCFADTTNTYYSVRALPRYEDAACSPRYRPRWYRWAWEAEIVDEMLMDLDGDIRVAFYGVYPLFTEEVELLPAYREYEDTCLEIQRQFLSLSSQQMVGNEVRLTDIERVAQQLQQVQDCVAAEHERNRR